MNSFIKIISIFLIQTFLLLNFSTAAMANILKEQKSNVKSCLSPQLSMSNESLSGVFAIYQIDNARSLYGALPFIDNRIKLKNNKTGDEIDISIATLKFEDLEEAREVHNSNWMDKEGEPRFVIDMPEARAMFFANPGGHLAAKNDKGEIIGVIWCASLFAESVELIDGPFKKIRSNRRNRNKDNVWLHYAVSARKDYLKMGFGAQIASNLLITTEAFTDNVDGVGNMARGTYSPMNGFGAFKGKCSPAAYLIKHKPSDNPKEDIGYLDWKYSEDKKTFREFLKERQVDPNWMQWSDYKDFVKYSGFNLTEFVKVSKNRLLCIAANLHVRNGAEVVSIVEDGREGDKESGECAMVILYRGLKPDLQERITKKTQLAQEVLKDRVTLSPQAIGLSYLHNIEQISRSVLVGLTAVVVQGDIELLDNKDSRNIEAIIASCLVVVGVNRNTGKRFLAHFLAAGDYGQSYWGGREAVKEGYIEKVFNSRKNEAKDVLRQMNEDPDNWEILIVASEEMLENLSPIYKISLDDLKGYLMYRIGISQRNIHTDAEPIGKKIVVKSDGRIIITPYSYEEREDGLHVKINEPKTYDLFKQASEQVFLADSLKTVEQVQSLSQELNALIAEAI